MLLDMERILKVLRHADDDMGCWIVYSQPDGVESFAVRAGFEEVTAALLSPDAFTMVVK